MKNKVFRRLVKFLIPVSGQLEGNCYLEMIHQQVTDLTESDIVEATHVIWTKPERLTSGKRDANLPAVDCAEGAGCILTWQEDPEGLRPGQGLGPGEGWSGAVANGKTDIWYSYIELC